ncbi:hypothetical protein QYE76_025714 [Lolium multiflorum]|uniref:Uncharacterized protein n=1 Tax=Lolium multiflorum TaxID=4521 RepID=A0AAD8RFY5_LOLMU|nr:hypothetical protein QYE76_025714 [Lolium multiflorum]
MKDTNICSDDIIRTFISRRVLPLKRRAHKMCEMYGPGDPTKITGLPLSKKDVVLKARQICQTSMPEDWEWGLRPLSSTNPPTQEAKDRFPASNPTKRGRCRKRGLDKFDPDPVIFWHVPSANIKPQVHEHVAPLQAEAGQEFVDKLMAQGKKNKTPAMMPAQANLLLPSASGPNLSRDLNSSSSLKPGTTWCRHHLCLPSGRHNKFGARPLHRQISARRRTLPPLQRPKTPAPATWAPEKNLLAGGTFGSSPSLKRRKEEDFLQDRAGNFRAGNLYTNAAETSPTRGREGPPPGADPAGPRSTEEHFTRLKHAVKEFDSAWYDATSNVVVSSTNLLVNFLDAEHGRRPKALFEELLWEHRSLAEAHSKCQAIPEASIEALKAQVAALQVEKKQLIRDHQKALEAQKEISRELKDQAMQAGVRYAEELKAAEAAAEARLNEALEDAGNANVVLQAELEEAAKALKTAEGKAAKRTKRPQGGGHQGPKLCSRARSRG